MKASWAHIPAVAEKLRRRELIPHAALSTSLPSGVLHHFASDCVEHFIQRYQRHFGEAHSIGAAALVTKRGWIEGRVSSQALRVCSDGHERLLREGYFGDPEAKDGALVAFLIQQTLRDDPAFTVREVLRCIHDLLTYLSKNANAWHREVDRQMLWEQERLSLLLNEFMSAQSQLLATLLRRRDLLEQALGTFQTHLEGVLY